MVQRRRCAGLFAALSASVGASLAFVARCQTHAARDGGWVQRHACPKLESRRQITEKDLVKEKRSVRKLLLNKKGAVWLWQMFCTEKGQRTADLIDIPVQLAAQFLATFVGVHAAVEWASKDLITELNEERMSPLAQWHWANYCERNCFSIRNPYNLPSAVVTDFLERYRGGAFGEVALCSEEVASKVKDLQKKGGTEQWKKYVRDKDFQSLDPLSYPESFVQGFIDKFDPQDLDDTIPREQILSSRSILNSALARLLTRFSREELTYELENRDVKKAKHRATLVLPGRAQQILPESLPMEFVGDWQRTQGAAVEDAAREAVTAFKSYGLA